MILCALAGLALERFAAVPTAGLGGLLVGIVVAQFVPLPTGAACARDDAHAPPPAR